MGAFVLVAVTADGVEVYARRPVERARVRRTPVVVIDAKAEVLP